MARELAEALNPLLLAARIQPIDVARARVRASRARRAAEEAKYTREDLNHQRMIYSLSPGRPLLAEDVAAQAHE